MTVAVDGVERYRWPVSTGLPSYETPNGSFRPSAWKRITIPRNSTTRRCRIRSSSPRSGHAIHGTDSVSRLGTPASHGCVRLSRANAATLYALVQEQGVLNTTVTLTGSSQVALARNPRPNTQVARRDPNAQQPYGQQQGQPQASPKPSPMSSRHMRRPASPSTLRRRPSSTAAAMRKSGPTTATSIRRTAARPTSAIRRRPAGCSGRRSISSSSIRSSSIRVTTIPPTRSRSPAPITSRGSNITSRAAPTRRTELRAS